MKNPASRQGFGFTKTGRKRKRPTQIALRQREYRARKEHERREANMSDEEQTYKERLTKLVDHIETIQKSAYFDGPASLQEKLTGLLTFARFLRDDPIPDYNPTTGAGVEEMGEVAQAFTDLSHESQAECSFEEDCGKHPVREKPVKVVRAKSASEE